MAKVSITQDGDSNPRRIIMNSGLDVVSKAKVYLQKVTSEQNSRVLDGLRRIVTNQVEVLERECAHERMSPQQADVLLKLTKTYQMMDSSTDKEHSKYDFSQYSEEELKKLAGSTE